MIQFNSDVIFVDTSGQVRAPVGSLTLRASGDVIASSSGSLRPEQDQLTDLGRADLKWRNLHATSGAFVQRPSVNQSGVLLQGEQGVFGNHFQAASSEGVTTVTGNVFVNKLTLTTPVVPSGTYRIGYSFEQRVSRRDRSFEIRVQLDGTDILAIERHIVPSQDPTVDDSWPRSGFAYRDLSAGSHTTTLDLRKVTVNNDFNISVRRVRLELWRVG